MSETTTSSSKKPLLLGALLLLGVAALGYFVFSGTKEISLVVETQPIGASVRLVSPTGRPDVTARDGLVRFDKLKTGQNFELSVSAAGFEAKSVTGVLEAKGDAKEQRLKVSLQREGGLISVQTTPRGANIFFNNEERGVGPMVLADIKPGRHSVSVTMPGYIKQTKQVTVQRGQKQTITFELVLDNAQVPEPPPSDDIKPGFSRLIATSTHRARFMVDNYQLSEGMSATRQVAAGRHRVTAVAVGRDTKWKMVDLDEGETITVNFEFNEDPIEKAYAIKDPTTPYHWISKGMSIRNEGRYGDAVSHFQKALEIAPDDQRAHRQLGRTLPGLKRYAEAIYHNERYLELSPEAPDAKFTEDLLVTLRQKASEEIENPKK